MKRRKNGENELHLRLPALSVNEGISRAAVAAFCAAYEPGGAELADIKCALSEAVTNAIVHAYPTKKGTVYITVRHCGGEIRIVVRDTGCGISDVAKAREPLFTTDPASERSGMGFTVMENFMDTLTVISKKGKGTTVVMTKRITGQAGEE